MDEDFGGMNQGRMNNNFVIVEGDDFDLPDLDDDFFPNANNIESFFNEETTERVVAPPQHNVGTVGEVDRNDVEERNFFLPRETLSPFAPLTFPTQRLVLIEKPKIRPPRKIDHEKSKSGKMDDNEDVEHKQKKSKIFQKKVNFGKSKYGFNNDMWGYLFSVNIFPFLEIPQIFKVRLTCRFFYEVVRDMYKITHTFFWKNGHKRTDFLTDIAKQIEKQKYDWLVAKRKCKKGMSEKARKSKLTCLDYDQAKTQSKICKVFSKFLFKEITFDCGDYVYYKEIYCDLIKNVSRQKYLEKLVFKTMYCDIKVGLPLKLPCLFLKDLSYLRNLRKLEIHFPEYGRKDLRDFFQRDVNEYIMDGKNLLYIFQDFEFIRKLKSLKCLKIVNFNFCGSQYRDPNEQAKERIESFFENFSFQGMKLTFVNCFTDWKFLRNVKARGVEFEFGEFYVYRDIRRVNSKEIVNVDVFNYQISESLDEISFRFPRIYRYRTTDVNKTNGTNKYKHEPKQYMGEVTKFLRKNPQISTLNLTDVFRIDIDYVFEMLLDSPQVKVLHIRGIIIYERVFLEKFFEFLKKMKLLKERVELRMSEIEVEISHKDTVFTYEEFLGKFCRLGEHVVKDRYYGLAKRVYKRYPEIRRLVAFYFEEEERMKVNFCEWRERNIMFWKKKKELVELKKKNRKIEKL